MVFLRIQQGQIAHVAAWICFVRKVVRFLRSKLGTGILIECMRCIPQHSQNTPYFDIVQPLEFKRLSRRASRRAAYRPWKIGCVRPAPRSPKPVPGTNGCGKMSATLPTLALKAKLGGGWPVLQFVRWRRAGFLLRLVQIGTLLNLHLRCSGLGFGASFSSFVSRDGAMSLRWMTAAAALNRTLAFLS